MSEMMVTLGRTTLGFLLLLGLTRLIGNKQLGQLNVFTYISGIAIGNMAGDMIIHRDVTLFDAIAGMVLWGLFTILIELFSLHSPRIRVLFDGEPVIVIKKGKIMIEQLKKQRLNMDDLTMLLRTNNAFSIQDVEYAILEPNGELSVLKKQQKNNITKEDMQIAQSPVYQIPTEIIVDGKVVERNLLELGLDKNWLIQQLKSHSIYKEGDVFYAELGMDGTLFYQLK